MRRMYSHAPTPAEAMVTKLEEELYSARRTIIDLMPNKVGQILSSYYSCETSQATRTWMDAVIDALIEFAEPLPNAAPGYLSTRAYCPLCHRGSSSPYTDGFTLSEGLRRHLSGRGHVQQCDVMTATMALARESWRSRFQASDAAEAKQAFAQKEQRGRTEILYRLGPNEEPQLVDEYVWGSRCRDPAELEWAEQRLSTLGFTANDENKIKSYTQPNTDFVVYADPRSKGEISFRVYLLSPPKSKRFGRKYSIFKMPDTWKHNLTTKFKTGLSSAINELSR